MYCKNRALLKNYKLCSLCLPSNLRAQKVLIVCRIRLHIHAEEPIHRVVKLASTYWPSARYFSGFTASSIHFLKGLETQGLGTKCEIFSSEENELYQDTSFFSRKRFCALAVSMISQRLSKAF